MSEQPGNRIPKAPSSPAWEGQDPSSGGDSTSGEMGGGWDEAPGKVSSPKVDGEEGQGIHVPHPTPGNNFSGR